MQPEDDHVADLARLVPEHLGEDAGEDSGGADGAEERVRHVVLRRLAEDLEDDAAAEARHAADDDQRGGVAQRLACRHAVLGQVRVDDRHAEAPQPVTDAERDERGAAE